MLELTINEKVYQFNFGMGFLREINKQVSTPVDGLPDVKRNIGLRYKVLCVLDGDPEALVDILDAANKGMNPRVDRNKLDAYIDSGDMSVDELCDKVIDFLKSANATRKTVVMLLEEIEKQQAAK
jgi:hypothetical protein